MKLKKKITRISQALSQTGISGVAPSISKVKGLQVILVCWRTFLNADSDWCVGRGSASPISSQSLQVLMLPGGISSLSGVKFNLHQQFSPIREALKGGEFNKSVSFVLNALKPLMA